MNPRPNRSLHSTRSGLRPARAGELNCWVRQISMVLGRGCITELLLAWSTCSMAAPIDVLVLETVLADFAQRRDTMSPHEDGIVLVQQETATWTLETIGYFSLGRDNQKCAIPSELFQSLVLRNPSKESVKSLLRPSSKWRVMLEGEEKTRPRTYLDKTAKGEAIKTIAWLSKPAYSSKGDTAFVLFHFRWSIHGAIAQYLMQRTGADWKVSCSDLVFYP